MIQIHPIEKVYSRSKYFQEFSPNSETWVVGDLKSKLNLQKKILKNQSGFRHRAVLRCGELWKELLKHVPENLTLISHLHLKGLIRSELRTSSTGRSPHFESLVRFYLNAFAPLFYRDEGYQQLEEWLVSHPESDAKMREWIITAHSVFKKCQSKGWMSVDWAPAYLLNVYENGFAPPKSMASRLIFDLGIHLTHTEAALIRELGKHYQVQVLIPQPSWKQDYHQLLDPYLYLMEDLNFKGSSSESTKTPPKVFTHRWSSVQVEVEWVVAKIREWLESGTKLDEILISAPDIEEYWPILKVLAADEGIPIQKATVVEFSSRVWVQNWLAHIRFSAGEIDYSNLAWIHEFDQEPPSKKLAFDGRYRKINREVELESKFKAQKRPPSDRHLTADQFLNWIWSDEVIQKSPDEFKKIVEKILVIDGAELRFEIEDWLSMLQEFVLQVETTIEPSPELGVALVNISESDQEGFSKKIYLGLTERGLSKKRLFGPSNSEVLLLNRDLGLTINQTDHAGLEFDLLWGLEDQCEEIHLSCPESSPYQVIENPSPLFLKNNLREGERSNEELAPSPLRWRVIKANWSKSLVEERSCTEKQVSEMKFRLEQDWNSIHPLRIKGLASLSHSASGLETFDKCPLKYMIQNAFRLRLGVLADLEIDPMNRGSLIHRLFEMITIKKFNCTESEIQSEIDRLAIDMDLPQLNKGIWDSQKQKFLRTALKFQEQEVAWKKNHPQWVGTMTEVPFEVYFDSKELKFHQQAGEGRSLFKGRIDRIDFDDEGRFVVIDYKSGSGSSLVGLNSAIKNSQLQLLFYTWMAQGGFLPATHLKTWVATVYYKIKSLDRSKGWAISETDIQKLSPVYNLPQKPEKFEEVKDEYFHLLGDYFAKLEVGQLPPEPKNEKECQRCEVRTVCRASHLNP